MEDLHKEVQELRKELRYLINMYMAHWYVKPENTKQKPRTRSYGSFKY